MTNEPVTKEDLILSEVLAIRSELIVIRANQIDYARDIAGLKVKTGLWSAAVSAVVAFFAMYFKGNT